MTTGADIVIEELRKENAQLRDLVEKMKRTIEELQRELEEWKQGHRVRGRRRRRQTKREPKGSDERKTGPRDAFENERDAGRRDGHEGAGRPGPEHVDRTVECRNTVCSCGGDLVDEGIGRRHRVEELVITVEVTEYQCQRQRCSCCGETTVAPLPAELGGAPKVGPQAQAVAMGLRYEYGLTVGAISRIFSGVFGLPFSAGGLSQMFHRNLGKCGPAVREIWWKVNDQRLVCVDETGWYEDGHSCWLWGLSNDELSAYLVSETRSRDTFRSLLDADYDGYVATDGYAAYNHLPEERHPQCWGHILRTARDLAQIHGDPKDAAVHDSIRDFLDLAKAHRAEPTVESREAADDAFDVILETGADASHPRLFTMADRLAKQHIRYMICLDDPTVPLTTNQIEGDLRFAVIARKTSFGTRSMEGSAMWGDGTTLAQTLKKQGSSMTEFVPQAIAAVARGRPPPSVFRSG